jgi:transcriptional regulator with XRE-family HTH domain
MDVTRTKKERQYNKLFGPYVRRARLEKFPDMTVLAFAESVGMTGPYLSKIETCRVPPPSETMVKAIADKLGEDPDSLLAMAGFIDPNLAIHLKPMGKTQFEATGLLRLMRGIQSGSTKFTTEQVVSFILGRSLEEHRILSSKEFLPELIEQLFYAAQHGGEFAEEFQPTLERGSSVLGEILSKIDEAKLEDERQKEVAKKARKGK